MTWDWNFFFVCLQIQRTLILYVRLSYTSVQTQQCSTTGEMLFGPKECQSLSLQQAQSKASCWGSSTGCTLTEAHGITPQRDQPYSLQGVESHSPSPPQNSRGTRGWKNEAKPGSFRRQGHCCSGLILQACDLPHLIQQGPPEAINIDKGFKRHVLGKGLLSLERSQADTSHMVISS